METNLEKRIKAEKSNMKSFNFLCKIFMYSLQNLSVKSSILFNHENEVFNLIYKIFKINDFRGSFRVSKTFLLFSKVKA